jgi:flagellar hook-length control protein FliK
MTNIPAMTPAVQPPCVTPRFTKPQPPPAGPLPPEGQGATPETGDEALEIAPVACLLEPGPQWRNPSSPGTWPLRLASTGQPLPYGGKGLPPRIPTLPVEMPATDGRRGMPLPAAIPAAPAPEVISAMAAARSAGAATESLPLTPAAPEPAPSRQPAEIVGRLSTPPTMPTLPVLPAARAQRAGADAPDAGPDLAATLRAPPADSSAAAAIPVPALQRQAGLQPTTSATAALAALLSGSAESVSGETGNPADGAIRSAGPDAATLPSTPPAAAAPATAPVAHAAAPAAAAMPMHLPEKVGSDEWNEAIAQRLSQLAESPHARASIRLNPPQLGPLQIEVQVDGDRAIVSFAVHHDATRDALEQAMPRLRAQLEGNGFASIDVGVSHNPHRERTGGGEAYLQSAFLPDDELAAAPPPGAARSPVSRLLDAYA